MTLWENRLEIMKRIKDLKQQSGSILIITAMMLPVMLGCLGFAYDFGNLYMHKGRLQNIADAAALAGGRAFLESRKKASDRDTFDPKVDKQFGRGTVTYKISGPEYNRKGSALHPDADKAADDCIMKNIANLGTPITCDILSHYALNSEGLNPKTFYRIGLTEMVPLHFLSVILDKNEQRVRAGAVVMVDDGKGFAVGNSLFENLFVVGEQGISLGNDVAVDSDKSTSSKPSDGGAEIKATFDGKIVIATDKANWASTEKGDYFYTEAEKNYQLENKETGNDYSIDEMNATPNMGGKAVRDNSIGIDYNVSGYLKKLEEPHFDLKKNCARENLDADTKINHIKASSLNNNLREKDKRRNYHYTIKTTIPPTDTTPERTEINYFHTHDNNGNRLISCVPRDDSDGSLRGKAYELVKGKTDLYYSLLSEGYQFKYYDSSSSLKGPTVCYTYVFDNKGNQIFCNYDRNKDQWTFYRKNVLAINPDSTREVEYRQLYTGTKITNHNLQELNTDENGNRYWSYHYPTPTDEEFNFAIKKETVEYSTTKRTQVNVPQITNSNVFHWEHDGWESREQNVPLTLEVNGLSGGDAYPLYIILTGNEGTPIKINVTKSNERPIIFCNLTTNEISEFRIGDPDGENTGTKVTFKGMIYSPFAKVVNAAVPGSIGGSFKGNIVAKGLVIQDSGIAWSHHNYLENDSDLNEVSDNAAVAQENRRQAAIAYAINKLGISDTEWNQSDWFGKQSSTKQAQIIQAWNAARQELLGTGPDGEGLDMPDWPWTDGGKPTDINQHHYSITNYESDSTVEILRLINFRTEYRADPYVDPFTHLTLPEDQ